LVAEDAYGTCNPLPVTAQTDGLGYTLSTNDGGEVSTGSPNESTSGGPSAADTDGASATLDHEPSSHLNPHFVGQWIIKA
jgi:hypothetical protein